MRGKTQPSKKSVQSGKQVAVVAAHRRGTGRKKSAAKGKLLSRALAPWGGQSNLAALNPQQLITRAIAKGDIGTVEKLLQMQRDLKAEAAREAFIVALGRFQRICPEIQKTKKVEFTTRKGGTVIYFYAPLDKIIKAVHVPLADCGFSYLIKGEQTEKQFSAIVHSYHVAGHHEETRFTAPIVFNDFMGEPQAVASVQSFCKRQAFCNAFGIVTHDMDDDGRAAGVTSDNGTKAAATGERRVGPEAPGTLPENPGIKEVEKLLKQMLWLPETTSVMYKRQAQKYVELKDAKSLRGLQQSLSKQIALHEKK